MKKAKTTLITFAHVVKRIVNRFHNDNLTAYSAQSAFFLFISFFPFLMLILNLMQYLPFSFDSLNQSENEFLSSKLVAIISSVITDATHSSQGAFISITTVAALWAASKGVVAVVRGLDSVFGTTEKRGYVKVRLLSLFYTLVFIATLIITLILIVFGNSILNAIAEYSPLMTDFTQLLRVLRWVFTLCALTLFFLIVYTIVPERKTKFKSELPGAVLSAAGWIGFSYLFSFYIDNIANYSNIYGSLTAVVILMLWVYACMLILFFGAEFNNFLSSVSIKRYYEYYKRRKAQLTILRDENKDRR